MRKFIIIISIILIIPAAIYAGFNFGLIKAVKKTGDKVDEKVIKKKAVLQLAAHVPTIPTNLIAVAVSSSQINLSWTAATDDVGVTSYKIYRNGAVTPIATPIGTIYSDTGLTVVTAYSYTVSACNAVGNCSSQSTVASTTTPDTQAPTVPSNLTAVAVSSCQINLSWTASTDNVGVPSYNIYRDYGATPIATSTGTTYNNTGLTAAPPYTYTLSACDAADNCSAQSASVSATALKWAFATGGHVGSSPAIGTDGTIYAGSNDKKLYAINPDGSQKWAFTTGGGVTSPAIGTDGTIYAGSGDKLYAINPNGSQKWVFATGGNSGSSPAVGVDGTVYFGAYNNVLYAINSAGGAEWAFTTGGMIESSPAIGADGTVYVGCDDKKLYAVNPNGSQKWTFTTGGSVESSPAIGADGTVYFGSYDIYISSIDGKFYAINPDGSEKWEFITGNYVESSPAIGADGTIYIGSDDSKLYAVNPEGSKKWEFATISSLHSSPAIGADGTVYVGSDDGRLHAINPNGSKKWELNIGNVYSSPTIGTNGTVYIGSEDGSLYAIYGDTLLATSAWPKFHRDLKNTGRQP